MSCGPRLIYNGLFQSGKVFYGQTSPNLTFLLEITDAVSSGLKRSETFQRVISIQFKASISDGMGGYISAYGMGSLHGLEGTMNAERYIKILEQHILPSRRRVSQHVNAKPHTTAITTAWLHSKIISAELACLQTRSFTYREHLHH